MTKLYVGEFRCVGRRTAWCRGEQAARAHFSPCYLTYTACEAAPRSNVNDPPCTEVGGEN